MKIFTKYFTGELIGPFFIGLGFFTSLIVLNPMVLLVDMFIRNHVPLKDVFFLFVYYLPAAIAIVLPMTVLLAVLMAYGRLSSDSEVIAMRASGISYIRIFYPAILLGIIISIVGFFFNDYLLPKGNYAWKKLYREVAQRKPLTQLTEHTIVNVNSDKYVRSIGVDKINNKTDIMSGVIIHEKDLKTGDAKTITAEKGKWLEAVEEKYPDGRIILIMRLQLENGNIQQPSKQGLDQFGNTIFKKLIVNFPQKIAYSTSVIKSTREMTTSEILAKIKKEKMANNIKSKAQHTLWVEYYKRLSIPFAALAFVIIGLPFSIVSGRSGKSVSLGVSIIIIFIYYILYTFGESIGKKGYMHELLALWIPNLFFLFTGGIYIFKISKT